MAQQMSCYAPLYVREHESDGEAPCRNVALPFAWHGVISDTAFLAPAGPSPLLSGCFAGLHTELSTTVFHIAALRYGNFLPCALSSLSKHSKSHSQKCRSLPVTLILTLHRWLLLPEAAAQAKLAGLEVGDPHLWAAEQPHRDVLFPAIPVPPAVKSSGQRDIMCILCDFHLPL